MPKLKSKRGAAKRFKRTGNGGFKHRASYRAHINTKMTPKRTRQLRGMRQVDERDAASIEQMLPHS